MLDLKTCYHADSYHINEYLLVDNVRAFRPNLIVFSLCYSNVSKVKNILERTGLLAERRLERNLIAATNGKAITLGKNQEKLIYEVANPSNVNKNVVIQGPEGSGKTLLGMEIVKLVVNNYIYTENLSPEQTRKDIRVILSACYNQPEQVNLWIQQVQSIVDRDQMNSLYEVRVVSLKTRLEPTPKAYNGDRNLILDLIRRDSSYGNYKKTIVMIDELRPDFESSDWDMYDCLESKGVNDVQIVFSLKYDFHDMKIRNDLNENDERYYDDRSIVPLRNVLVGRLNKAYRCSNEIRNFIYYLLMHEFNGNLHRFKSFHHDEPSFDAKEKPIWINTIDSKSFFDLVNKVTLFQNIPRKTVDVALIYDPETIDPRVKSECDTRKWKHVPKEEVVGTEFSTVIIYDLKEFHFDAFSRAINRMIIVTTYSTGYVLVCMC